MNIFADQIEQEAITRIRKFAKLAKSMGFDVCVGFSGVLLMMKLGILMGINQIMN